MTHRSHPAHRRSTQIAHRSPFIERVTPGDSRVYMLEEPRVASRERARLLIIAANVGVHVLSLIGLFALITTGQPEGRLLIWQSTMIAGGALSAAITTYYFTRRMELSGRSHPREPETQPAAAGPIVPIVPIVAVGNAEPPGRPRSVAIIGSFRKFYPEVCQTAGIFIGAGLTVAAPVISSIINPGADFVRFAVDPPGSSDEDLQALALARILAADLVYVVAPGGYIGRTTCYELGQVFNRGIPVFYSHRVGDLPISIPEGAVCEATALAAAIAGDRTG